MGCWYWVYSTWERPRDFSPISRLEESVCIRSWWMVFAICLIFNWQMGINPRGSPLSRFKVCVCVMGCHLALVGRLAYSIEPQRYVIWSLVPLIGSPWWTGMWWVSRKSLAQPSACWTKEDASPWHHPWWCCSIHFCHAWCVDFTSCHLRKPQTTRTFRLCEAFALACSHSYFGRNKDAWNYTGISVMWSSCSPSSAA